MAIKTLIFGIDDLYPTLKPYYEREVLRGTLEVVAYAVLENDAVTILDATGRPGGVTE